MSALSSHHKLYALGLAGLLAACSGTVAEEGALARGDQAWVAGDVEEALAEYRLALQQGSTDAEVYARIGHAYAELGKIDEASDHYHLAAERDSAYTEQAVSDLVRLARAAETRGDRFGVAAAMEASLEFRPGVSVAELALPLARYYAQSGEYGRALPFYAKALATAPADTASDVLFETGLAHEQVGDCERALVFYEQFAEVATAAQQSEASWRIGECSYLLATRIRSDLARARREGVVPPGGIVAVDELPESEPGELLSEEGVAAMEEVALMHLERTIALGEPRNRQAQAHFEKGELLAARGECEAAVEAFRQVGRVDPSGTGALVARARERIDEIRFRPFRMDLPEGDPRAC